jgi:hypothetical protein
MAELDKKDPVSLTELMVSTLAMADAVTKLLIEKGVITEAEFRKNFYRSVRCIRSCSTPLCNETLSRERTL